MKLTVEAKGNTYQLSTFLKQVIKHLELNNEKKQELPWFIIENGSNFTGNLNVTNNE